ncbi:GNAT family acetyltransferase [Pyrenophora teres f. maculata]|nr:GNAT family acetyltransferase [Pyrenophora teres f. maculata]
MTLTVCDVSDEHILRACEIEFVAYKDSPLAPVLLPGPLPSDAVQERARELIESRRNDPTVYYRQCRDEVTGKMVAFTKYLIVQNPDDVATPTDPPHIGSGRNIQATLMYTGSLAQKKREILGNRPHMYLHLLHTDPDHQGRGAGGLLLDWGIKRADELGLPIYLESSAAGHRFYQNRGFKDVEFFKVDFTPWGGPIHQQPLMLREPL